MDDVASNSLSPDQAHALFDILIHHEVYEELRDLRLPETLAHSGPPFKTLGEENQTPLLQALFSKFVVPLPGLRDVSANFYPKCQEIVDEFARADLSESYEAGYIGIRKTLATATAALTEAPARGFFGGFLKKELRREDGRYDATTPEDVAISFGDFLQRLVYDDLIDEIFAAAAKTDKLDEHTPLIQAAHEYILIILASFLHYIFVISPEGQTILTMIKRAHSIIPYTAIRQTLRVGNAGTMINGMVMIVLTKMTINSVTTLLGITNASDAGRNLLQTIISTVVNWDTSELKRRSFEIEKSGDGPSKTQCELLRSYIEMNRDEHEKCRMMSEAKSEPIVVVVMEEYGGDELSGTQVPLALDYLSLQVSLRDRRKITDILCSRQPDLLTQVSREGLAAYDPVIRALHNAVDLSATVADLEAFIEDLLKFAPSNVNAPLPSIGDFVQLLRKHQQASHRFIHQVCKNGPELTEWYKEYAKSAAAEFRVDDCKEDRVIVRGGAGKLSSRLSSAVLKLSEKQRAQILAECDAHAVYLAELSIASKSGIELAINQSAEKAKSTATSKPNTGTSSPSKYKLGPGMFLRRWQAYINETSITPVQSDGPVRHGGDSSVVNAGRLLGSASTKSPLIQVTEDSEVKAAPSCVKTVELLAGRFREMLKESRMGVLHESSGYII